MIDIPAALQARLDAGATTLAWCWVLTRRDGAVLGFTDHDRTLDVVGVICEPASGFSAGSARVETGASPARSAVFGALNSARISKADLDNGLWAGAQVELYRVDWNEPELIFKAFTGALGAVSRSDTGFEAEVEGLSARLNARIGRRFSKRCDAELGDVRCGVDLSAGGFVYPVAVETSLNASGIVVSGGAGRDESWFVHGVLTWTSGPNTGASHRVLVDRPSGSDRILELDPVPARRPETGDAALLTAGCDKRFETCRSKFANRVNFRGCPHMPGNDVLLHHAASEDIRDGGRR